MANSQTMRECLLPMVEAFDGGSIKHALFTTFNFDPGFFEKNVLPLLCGLTLDDVRAMSIEALARKMYHPLKELQVVIAYDQAVLQGFKGRFRYTLLPMHQKGGFFHAKIIVLTGVDAKQKPMATVMVSSGNMTISGWGNNTEVVAWTLINKANAEELWGFYQYLNEPQLDLGKDILKEIKSKEASPKLFLHYPSERGSLFERIFNSHLTGDMHIFSPYWGEKAIMSFKKAKGSVHCYPANEGRGYIFPMAPECIVKQGIEMKAIKGEEPFRHAKAYYWNGYMCIGSANCTSQALHSQNNVEAMLLFTDQPEPDILTRSEPLKEWLSESSAEEGLEPIPVGVLIIADYAKRCYQVSIQVSDAGCCATWELSIGDIKMKDSANLKQYISFEKTKGVAQVYRIDWKGNAGSKFLTGMIIPKGGSDAELGYRPKRCLDKILQDMLRHKVSVGGEAGAGDRQPDTDDDVEADDAENAPEPEDYEFDMYGMYQSFYHLKKVLDKAKTQNPEWMYAEISDTLQEIILAIQNEEIKKLVQRWLMLQEALALAEQLPLNHKNKFTSYDNLQRELKRQLLDTLTSDESLKGYKITPVDLLNWTSKELGYEH